MVLGSFIFLVLRVPNKITRKEEAAHLQCCWNKTLLTNHDDSASPASAAIVGPTAELQDSQGRTDSWRTRQLRPWWQQRRHRQRCQLCTTATAGWSVLPCRFGWLSAATSRSGATPAAAPTISVRWSLRSSRGIGSREQTRTRRE